ncbi:hypothetical protein TRIP_C60274 [Candidatus Zixiibacteriota bacterium]|nr:hypothetical protein TRIP_C60274 [candidate division Zixibacteria bacterium]
MLLSDILVSAWAGNYAKRLLIFMVIVMPIAFSGASGAAISGRAQMEKLRLQPLAFTANRGQWSNQARFRAGIYGGAIWFADNAVYYQFIRPIGPARSNSQSVLLHNRSEIPRQESLLFKTSLEGACPDPLVIGEDEMDYKCNYFHGNDSNLWRTDVPNYESILYNNIYDGIDMRFHGNGEKLEYDFLIRPGADPSLIKIRFDGASSLRTDSSGELIVATG